VADGKKRKWIGGATENSHGQFREKAERAGKSTAAYAREHEDDPGKLGKQARLAETLMKLHGSVRPASPKRGRESMYGKDKE
jgi:hypothetical protein